MCLNKAEREFFQKLFYKKPKIKQCKVVGHFLKEGIARQTVYKVLNRRKNGQSILEENRSLSPWAPPMKGKLKRLLNNRKRVSQQRVEGKFN